MALSILSGIRKLCYSIELGEQYLNLCQSNVLSLWIVQEMRCGDDKLDFWIVSQSELTHHSHVLSIEKLQIKMACEGVWH